MATRGPKLSSFQLPAIYKLVAERTVLPVDTVRQVIDNFLDVIKTAVLQQQKVQLRTFGAFKAKRLKRGPRIAFQAAGEFKEGVKQVLMSEEPEMEKYGVETKNEAVMMAEVTGQCPACKATLTTKKPPHCPNCGTKPFEEPQK